MNRLINSLQTRLALALTLLVIIIMLIAWLNVQNNARLEQNIHQSELAGRQRSNAYLLASLTRRLADVPDETTAQGLEGLIQTTITNFDSIQNGLRQGDKSLSVQALERTEIISILDELDERWAVFRQLIETFVSEEKNNREQEEDEEAQIRIDTASVAVFAYADQLTQAIEVDIEQQNRVANRLLISLIILGGFAIAFAVYVLLQSTRDINQLANSATQFAQGDLTARVSPSNLTELRQVGTVFNTMAERISHLIQDLQGRITETEAARDRAEQSDKVKSAFLASMSHELRTPLNAVINFTRFVMDGDTGPVNEEQIELLGEVVSSAKHLLSLINDVLDMSKIESGSLNLFMEEDINLNALLTSAVHTGKGLLHSKPVELKTTIPDSLPLLYGDRQRLLQILLNIISNACKFTQEGAIHISAERQADEILISVVDTGPGIDPQDQALVFEPFKQTKTGLRQGGGTGLGMPIAKSLAEAHGGRIWLESQPRQGSTFYMMLPIRAKTSK